MNGEPTKRSASVSWDAFEVLFLNGLVRVYLNREEVSQLPVPVEVFDQVDANWYTSWYAKEDADGLPTWAAFDDAGARPVQVGEMAELVTDRSAQFKQSIPVLGMAAHLAQYESNSIMLASWRCPDGTVLLMDGNHRAVALWLLTLLALESTSPCSLFMDRRTGDTCRTCYTMSALPPFEN